MTREWTGAQAAEEAAASSKEIDSEPRRARAFANSWAAFVLPPLLVICVIVVLPTIQLISNSFYRWSLLSGMKRFDGLGQYAEVLTDSLFIGSLARTLSYTLVVVAVELLLGLGVALLLDQDYPGIRFVRTTFLTPMLMVPIMVGLLWTLMFQPSIGVINYVLGGLGIEPIDWLSSSVLALPAVGIAEVWQWTPFVGIVLLAGLQSLPQNVLAAARLDGAGRLRRLVTIELPIMRNVIAIVFLLRFIDVFKTFGLVYIMTRGGPGRATMLAGFYPWEVGFTELLMGRASAAAFILMNVISIMTLILLHLVFKPQEST
jgi:multiple sugar transport system permease protein